MHALRRPCLVLVGPRICATACARSAGICSNIVVPANTRTKALPGRPRLNSSLVPLWRERDVIDVLATPQPKSVISSPTVLKHKHFSCAHFVRIASLSGQCQLVAIIASIQFGIAQKPFESGIVRTQIHNSPRTEAARHGTSFIRT